MGWCIYMWMVWQYFFIGERKFTAVSETSAECTASTRQSTILVAMRRSHDENGLIQMNMYSIGVMDLDFGLLTTQSL